MATRTVFVQTDIAGHRSRIKLMLAAIIAAAVVLRVASALWQGSSVESLPGVDDQISYDMLARQLLAGNGFTFPVNWWPVTQAGEPTAHWSFLYSLYLATIYGLFGPQPLIARLLQAVFAGVVLPWLTWRIGRRVFGDWVGLIAAAISAVYIYFFYYAGALMTETFYIVSILWTIDCAMRIAASGPASLNRWMPWLELGLAMAVTVLLRQLFLLVVPVVLLWLWWFALRKERRLVGSRAMLVRLAGSIAVAAALILPWTARNYLAFGRLVPLNTNSGYAFFWANHPIHGTEFIAILPDSGRSYRQLIPKDLRGLDEAALDQALLQEGMRFVVEDPWRYFLLSLSRIKDYFMFWPSSESNAISNLARVASFALFLPLMLIGLLRSLTSVRPSDKERGPTLVRSTTGLVLLLSFMATYTAIHLLSWALIRYRLPVDAILVMFAGAGLVETSRSLASAHRHKSIQGKERTE